MRRSATVVVSVAVVLGGAAAGCTAPAAERSPGPPPLVATSEGASPTRSPTVTPPPTVRLSVLGDIGAYDASGAVLDGIADRDDDLTVVVGDLSYGEPGEEERWCRFVTSRLGATYPFELVAGNHEDDGPNGSIDRFRRCLPNRLPGLVGDYGRQWYVDVPAADPVLRLVMVSPGLDFGEGAWTYARGTSHYAWTERAVTGARRDGIPWVLVGMHEPCLSVGVYPCSSGPDLMNILLREGVDLVLSGHEHMYQRTVPVSLGPGCPAVRPDGYDPDCTATGDGTVFVTVGTGGQALRDADRSDPEWPWFAAVSAADRDPAWGSLAVRVTPDRLAARFRPVAGSSFTDAFVVRHRDGERVRR